MLHPPVVSNIIHGGSTFTHAAHIGHPAGCTAYNGEPSDCFAWVTYFFYSLNTMQSVKHTRTSREFLHLNSLNIILLHTKLNFLLHTRYKIKTL